MTSSGKNVNDAVVKMNKNELKHSENVWKNLLFSFTT